MSNNSLLASLRAHFATGHWPRFNDINQNQNHALIDISIDNHMLWLEGHFPQQPVVAGVVQTHWAGEIAKYLFNAGDEFIRIDNLKFQQVILPGQILQLSLEYNVGENISAVKFRYHQGDSIFSEGKLVFQTQAAQSQ